MAANVVVLTDAEWTVVSDVLARLGEGGILVPPDGAKKFKEKHGKDVPDGELIEYDFGGDSDVWVDVMHEPDGLAADAIVADMGYENSYRCDDCSREWTCRGDSAHDDECPKCGKDYTPYKSVLGGDD